MPAYVLGFTHAEHNVVFFLGMFWSLTLNELCGGYESLMAS